MVGTVKEAVPSFMCPWLVAAQAKALFGNVSVGTELYQWSQTPKPAARPDSTGSAAGGNIPMMAEAGGPACTLRRERWWRVLAWAKFVAKPGFVAVGGLGGLPLPNSCSLVFEYPSPGSAPGMKEGPPAGGPLW